MVWWLGAVLALASSAGAQVSNAHCGTPWLLSAMAASLRLAQIYLSGRTSSTCRCHGPAELQRHSHTRARLWWSSNPQPALQRPAGNPCLAKSQTRARPDLWYTPGPKLGQARTPGARRLPHAARRATGRQVPIPPDRRDQPPLRPRRHPQPPARPSPGPATAPSSRSNTLDSLRLTHAPGPPPAPASLVRRRRHGDYSAAPRVISPCEGARRRRARPAGRPPGPAGPDHRGLPLAGRARPAAPPAAGRGGGPGGPARLGGGEGGPRGGGGGGAGGGQWRGGVGGSGGKPGAPPGGPPSGRGGKKRNEAGGVPRGPDHRTGSLRDQMYVSTY